MNEDCDKMCGPGERYLPVITPCPFCGDTRGFMSCLNGDYAVRCQSCAAVGPWSKSETSAAALWTRRVTEEKAS